MARYYCRTAHQTFSLLPDFLASRLSSDLGEVEMAVVRAEASATRETAATKVPSGHRLRGIDSAEATPSWWSSGASVCIVSRVATEDDGEFATPSDIAKGLPLSHGVPETRASTWTPASDLIASESKASGGEKRVCFYLGPLRNRTTKYPIMAFVFEAGVEGGNWYAYPCDIGGTGLTGAAREGLKLVDGKWRNYVQEFVQRSLSGDWSAYVSGTAAPDLSWLSKSYQSVVKPRRDGCDPAGWTPEVRSPSDVPISQHVIKAGLNAPALASATARFADFVGALGASVDHEIVTAALGETTRELLVAWTERIVQQWVTSMHSETKP